jgi:ABC-2 type transport system permease protein
MPGPTMPGPTKGNPPMALTSYALRDSRTMLRRNIKHAQRNPSMTISIVAMPILMLLLFVYAFGDALGNGIAMPGGGKGRGDYLDYITPGILLMTVTGGAISTAVSVCSDKTEGIINRFRTLRIARGSVLTGHVVGNLVQAMISLAVVIVVALALGFRTNGSVAEWAAAIGLLMLLAFSLGWLSAAIGMVTQTVETASNAPMPLTFLPLLGSAIVPPESMPTGLRWFAENQPFTPLTETLRGLLLGTRIGNDGWISLGWCVGICLVGYLWARWAFRRGVRT